MQCFNHPDVPAVMQCKGGCTKGLCKECAEKYKEPYCDDCVQKVDSQNKGNLEESIEYNKKLLGKLKFCVGWGTVWVIAFLLLAIVTAIIDYQTTINKPLETLFGIIGLLLFAFLIGCIPFCRYTYNDNRSAELKELQKINKTDHTGARIAGMLIGGTLVFPYNMYKFYKQIEVIKAENVELEKLLATHN